MPTYTYDEGSNTYKLDPGTQDFSLADVPDDTATNVEGNALDNVITGNDQNNFLDGSDGADTLIGGAGDDEYNVNEAGDVVIEEADGGIDKIVSYVSYTLPDHVEILDLHGYEPLTGTGNDQDNAIFGNVANNLLRGEGGDDKLFGGDGDDTLEGGAGADRLWGNDGNDTYIIDEDDEITEDADGGNDTVIASFSYTLGNNFENLRLTGTQALTGTGNALDNRLIGADGDDHLYGLGGDDTLSGGAGDDVLDGGDGTDTALYAGDRATTPSPATPTARSPWSIAARTATAPIRSPGSKSCSSAMAASISSPPRSRLLPSSSPAARMRSRWWRARPRSAR